MTDSGFSSSTLESFEVEDFHIRKTALKAALQITTERTVSGASILDLANVFYTFLKGGS